jgi:hypothetical protein
MLASETRQEAASSLPRAGLWLKFPPYAMQGKYDSWYSFLRAYAYRQWVRRRLDNLVTWPHEAPREPGCSALIGMCHRLPDVLTGNLKCLGSVAWPELKEVIIVVDSARGCLPSSLEAEARAACPRLPLRFEYYSREQADLTERIRLPYVFSWLSWSIAISLCRTKHALLQDYDALVLDDTLARRYAKFAASGASVQGIKWYTGNGVLEEDRLATTFEAFFDVGWVRRFKPIQMFNQVGLVGNHSRDYDTLLDIQHRHTPLSQRTIEPMPEDSLVHPSQMIHQYTMFRRAPTKAQPCASILMIPFFEWFSGKSKTLGEVTRRLRNRQGRLCDLFGDGVRVNLSELTIKAVDWDLKQMVRVCLNQNIAPVPDLATYGTELYALCDAPAELVWAGDFTPEQRRWIDAARNASDASRVPSEQAYSA